MSLSGRTTSETWESEALKVFDRKSLVDWWRSAHVPWSVFTVPGSFCRLSWRQTELPQLLKASAASLPSLPDQTSQLPTNPLFKLFENAGSLTEPKVSDPTIKVGAKFFDYLFERVSAFAAGNFSYSLLCAR